MRSQSESAGLRRTWCAPAAVALSLLLGVGMVGVLLHVKHAGPAGAQEAEEAPRGIFLRPGFVEPGGTYEIYLDVEGAQFSGETVVEVESLSTAALQTRVRNEQGLTIVLGVAADQALGELPIRVHTPLADGTQALVEAVLVVRAPGETGPALTFENLPAEGRIVAEGAFAHFHVAV